MLLCCHGIAVRASAANVVLQTRLARLSIHTAWCQAHSIQKTSDLILSASSANFSTTRNESVNFGWKYESSDANTEKHQKLRLIYMSATQNPHECAKWVRRRGRMSERKETASYIALCKNINPSIWETFKFKLPLGSIIARSIHCLASAPS